MIDLRLPSISGLNEAQQLQQMRNYLYQVVEQMNNALAVTEKETAVLTAKVNATASKSAAQQEEERLSQFNGVKALIIKSADIINAYYEEISTRLSGDYVAQSEFGTYRQQTEAEITANSTGITQAYTDIETIRTETGAALETATARIANIENENAVTKAYVKTGLLYYEDNIPVYGVEIGQTNDGAFKKFTRLSSEKLSFYDQNENEVAYISDERMVINAAKIKGSLELGKYILDTTSGMAFKWIG